jgi:deazaflavin-dependent oxidoreductase (nitroreductase family)
VHVIVGVAIAYLVVKYLISSLIRIVVWRSHWKPGLDVLRRYNKAVMNPAALRAAGKKGSRTTAVHHVGRRSGRAYVTPVWAERDEERFFIQLPYGTDVDWCRNVLDAGRCVLEHDGVTYDAFAPVLVPAAEAAAHLPPATRRMQHFIGAESYLRLEIRASRSVDEIAEPEVGSPRSRSMTEHRPSGVADEAPGATSPALLQASGRG